MVANKGSDGVGGFDQWGEVDRRKREMGMADAAFLACCLRSTVTSVWLWRSIEGVADQPAWMADCAVTAPPSTVLSVGPCSSVGDGGASWVCPTAFMLRESFVTAVEKSEPESDLSSFTFSSGEAREEEKIKTEDSIYVKTHKSSARDPSSITMPMSFMTGSVVGKRFYQNVTTREADDGNGWNVMLDYRTLKTPGKRPLNLPTHSLAKAIAAEWEYQQDDGIRPFMMPLMKLACTALERVPLTRTKIIENLMKNFHQDLVFCRSPGDNELTRVVYEWQVEKIDPLLNWVESEFGFKPVTYSSFFGGKQEDGLTNAIGSLLKKTNDTELAAIDAMAASAHSLIIAIGIYCGRLQIEEAIELIRLEEDMQVDRWGLVEGGHDVDVADLEVQISSAAVFLGLSQRVGQV